MQNKKRLITVRDFSLRYLDAKEPVFTKLNFEMMQGERVFLSGSNGCGKSSLIKAILKALEEIQAKNLCFGIQREPAIVSKEQPFEMQGELSVAANLVISYVNQDTSNLRGKLKDYADRNNLNYTLLLSLLRQLDFERVQFGKNMEEFSEGQKKKVLIAASLLTPAHLYIWDEPLNYIDVFSRMQIEKLIETYQPTMLIVEHDERFCEKLSTQVLEM